MKAKSTNTTVFIQNSFLFAYRIIAVCTHCIRTLLHAVCQDIILSTAIFARLAHATVQLH